MNNPEDLKVGNILFCHTPCIMSSGEMATSYGKKYEILSINFDREQFCIYDDLSYFERAHWFSFNIYTDWFRLDDKEIRKR